jgi:hypothetical protein
MWTVITQAWHDLTPTGRAALLIVLILAITGLLAVAMWLGYRLDWLPPLLEKAITHTPKSPLSTLQSLPSNL